MITPEAGGEKGGGVRGGGEGGEGGRLGCELGIDGTCISEIRCLKCSYLPWFSRRMRRSLPVHLGCAHVGTFVFRGLTSFMSSGGDLALEPVLMRLKLCLCVIGFTFGQS